MIWRIAVQGRESGPGRCCCLHEGVAPIRSPGIDSEPDAAEQRWYKES